MALSIARSFEVEVGARGSRTLRHFVLSTSAAGVQLVPLVGHGSRSLARAFGVCQAIAREHPVTVIDPYNVGATVERITRSPDRSGAPEHDDEWRLFVSIGANAGHRHAIEKLTANGEPLTPNTEMVMPPEEGKPGGAVFWYGSHHLAADLDRERLRLPRHAQARDVGV